MKLRFWRKPLTEQERKAGEEILRRILMREAMIRHGMDPNKSIEDNLYTKRKP